MKPCDEYRPKTLRDLDGDLQGHELDDFCTHVESCADCRASLEAELALSHLLHRSRPLYPAPAALRSRVSAAVMQHSESKPGRARFYQCAWQMLERELVHLARRLLSSRPLGLRSTSSELVTAWFTSKVPFNFRLPNAQSASNDTLSYRLTGASVVSYRGNPAALVAYEREKENISLLVASSDSAPVAGGDEVRFGDLTFHYRTNDGFKMITWSNHGLSYALVSSVSGSARESCLVCHQNMSDHHTLRPSP
jgi:hypothetical protein